MPTSGLNVDWKWVGTFAIGIIVAAGGYQVRSLHHRIESGDQLVLEKAKGHADNHREGRFSNEMFQIAMAPRDTEVDRQRLELDVLQKEIVELRTLVNDYRRWTQKQSDRIIELTDRLGDAEGQVLSVYGLLDEVETAVKEISDKQDDVRENRIPEVRQKLDAHLSSPHMGPLRMPDSRPD